MRILLTLNGLAEYAFFFLTVFGAIILRFREPDLPRPVKPIILIRCDQRLCCGKRRRICTHTGCDPCRHLGHWCRVLFCKALDTEEESRKIGKGAYMFTVFRMRYVRVGGLFH
jgi:hypothetical protein